MTNQISKSQRNNWNTWGIPPYSAVMKCKGNPKLFNETGGELKEDFKTILKWYSQQSRDQSHQHHTQKLLAQFPPSRSESNSQDLCFPPRRPRTSSSSKNWSYWTKKLQLPPESRSQNLTGLKIEGRTIRSKPPSERSLSSKRRSLNLPKPRIIEEDDKVLTINRGSDYKVTLRPKSAMAAIENHLMNPYTTSYDINYGQHPLGHKSSIANRPKTSKGFGSTYDLSGSIGRTHFDDEYGIKKGEKSEPIRSGTSSGSRSNNPHPDQAFMIWRYCNKRDSSSEDCGAPAANRNYRKLTDDVLDEIVRDNFRSTYDQDFLGIPQGFQMKDAIAAPVDWRDQVPKPADTSSRRTYQIPVQHSSHKLPTSRYDCNKLYVKPAVGIVPTVIKQHVINQNNIKEKTVYKEEYFDRSVNDKLNRLLNQRLDRDWNKFYLQATSLNSDKSLEEI